MIMILANAGVPMIFITLPPMVVLIIPVIIIEFLVSRRLISRISPARRWAGIGFANVVSTFIGWPAAWFVLVLLQMVTGGGGAHGLNSPLGVILSVTQQAPWLIPYEGDLYWMIPVAMFVLLIPFFFASVYFERFMLRWVWKNAYDKEVVRFSWIGNLYSYLFLLLVVFAYGTYNINTK